MTMDLKLEAENLLASGLSVAEVVETTGLSKSSVYRIKSEIQESSYKYYSLKEKKTIVKHYLLLRKQKLTIKEICSILGHAPIQLSRWTKELGKTDSRKISVRRPKTKGK